MCQSEICGCGPARGAEGPRVSVVIDRRVRPWTGRRRERRVAGTAVLEDRRLAARNEREREAAAAGETTWLDVHAERLGGWPPSGR